MQKTNFNFIPNIQNPSPDYYCTWQTQLYATSDGKPAGQRRAMNEESMFSDKFPYGWTSFYEKARGDLFFVMDDSWDVPPNGNEKMYGSLILDRRKFASFYEDSGSELAMKRLCERIRSLGWKGLGGWVCAQESPSPLEGDECIAYWTERLRAAQNAGVRYWKVDWGAKAGSEEFRRMLSTLSHEVAPSLTVENAFNADFISFSDVYRTYDVPAVMSIPMTMEKLAVVLEKAHYTGEAKSLVNCEDEAYAAAAGGFTMGIMRHPYCGNLPDGRADMSFPECHRDLKRKTEEVLRAVRWHRIAPAFAADKDSVTVSEKTLTDTWRLQNADAEIESWWLGMDAIKNCLNDGIITKTACSAMSRNMPLPQIAPDENGEVPYAIAAKNPNGAVSAAFLARTNGRRYYTPRCDAVLDVQSADTVGLFGYFKSITLKSLESTANARIYAQNLSDDFAYDITDNVYINRNAVTILFSSVEQICTAEDKSEPGLVIKILKENTR